jgi:hypothetical protein
VALWLECERWYVGTAVPEGVVVGGLLGVAEWRSSWCRGGGPETLSVWWLVGGLASLSVSERPVSAPPIAVTASSLRRW